MQRYALSTNQHHYDSTLLCCGTFLGVLYSERCTIIQRAVRMNTCVGRVNEDLGFVVYY